MSLKNYTSSVPADRSISYIERTLARAGAMHISKSYKHGTDEVEAMMFQLEVRDGKSDRMMPVVFKLPVHVDEVFQVIYQEVKRPRPETEKRYREQANRTAWKILYDWVEVQVTMVRLQQAQALEVFLPYAFDPTKGKTLYQRIAEDGLRMIAPDAGKGREQKSRTD